MTVVLEQDQEMIAKRAEMERRWPKMPKGFWPDSLTVNGVFEGKELGFQITVEEFEDNILDEVFKRRLKDLRNSLWQLVKHDHEGLT